MARRSNIHTVFHSMEERGYFERNPANADSRDQTTGESLYKGPVQYPKMLYHPKGAERIITPAEIIVTPMGPQRVGEQRQLVYRLVANEQEEKEFRSLGWHFTPAQAVRARLAIEGKDLGLAPPKSADETIQELNDQIAALQAERADREAKLLAESRAGGGIIEPVPAAVASVAPLPDPARMGL
jgi:hypothetical protein